MGIYKAGIKLFSVLFLLIFSSVQAEAALKLVSPCQIFEDKQKLEAKLLQEFNPQKTSSFFIQLKKECDLETRLYVAQLKFEDLGVRIDDLAIYRALRFINFNTFEWAKTANYPVPYIFQRSKELRDAPLEKRERIVWDAWTFGINKVDAFILNLMDATTNSLQPLTLDGIKLSHKVFYEVETRVGTPEEWWDPNPGLLKTFESYGSYERAPWWTPNDPLQLERMSKVADSVNLELARMGLIPEVEGVDSRNRKLNWVIKVEDKNIYSADSRIIEQSVINWQNYFNKYLDVLTSRYQTPLTSSDRLMTPLEFSSFMQQWFVMLHPFWDGNGRTSRFWQDLILRFSGLPYAPAGLLTNDVEYNFDEYPIAVTSQIEFVLSEVEKCILEWQKPELVSYNCKVVE